MSVRVAMWGKALYGIPRVNKAEWDDLDIVGRWLIATRAAVLVMTFVSSAIAGLLALRAGKIDWTLWGVNTLGLVLAHATNNIVNDLTDSWQGVDKDNYFRTRYGTQPIEHGLLTKGQAIGYAAVTGAVALACGLYLASVRGPSVLALVGAGAFFVLFYTWPLKHIGMGEIAVILVWGPLMVGGSYFVITGIVDTNVVLASAPFALAATAVLFGKHIDKIDADRAKRVRTLPVILGAKASRFAVAAMVIAQYAFVAYLIVTGYFSPALLVVTLAGTAAWLLLRAYSQKPPKEPPPELPKGVWPLWYSAFAFHHTRRFGMLYLLGIAADVVLRRMGVLG
jgi:1,4-dihydroxy-2-naphthoate octaprenyltransferase